MDLLFGQSVANIANTNALAVNSFLSVAGNVRSCLRLILLGGTEIRK